MLNKLLFVISLFVVSQAWAGSEVLDIWRNNQGVDHMQQKKVIDAHEQFTQLLAQDPFHPVFQFNMGTSFLGIEDVEKAIQMYKELTKLDPLPPTIEFAAHYNLGVLYGMTQKLDKALESYQKALQFNPDSKEIKINIELLFKGKGGGGKGGGKSDKDQKKDKENKEDGKQPQEPQKFTNKKQQPGQFDGKEMSKGDVKKILDELKKQEQRIRAKHERKGKREADRAKSW